MISLAMGPVIAGIKKIVPPKYIVYLLIAAALTFSGWYLRDLQADRDVLAAVNRAIAQANAQAEIDSEIMRDHIRTEKEIEIRYEVIEKKIGLVSTPDCDDLGPEWVGMFNEITEAGSP